MLRTMDLLFTERLSLCIHGSRGCPWQTCRACHLEHDCCRFLAFKIIVEPGDSPIQLEVTGPPEAKITIADFFGAQKDDG